MTLIDNKFVSDDVLGLLDDIVASRSRISVIGSMNVDYTVTTKRLPKPGETVNGGPLTLLPGGKSANQASAAARGWGAGGGLPPRPIDMEPASSGLKAADASFHLEADIHASQEGTDYGYGKGDFVPDLTVNYTIIDKSTGKEVEGGKATSGTFMQMNASDGPHYGANVKLDKAGTYQLKLSIESPAAKGWMLHVDPETGVKNHQFWTEPIEVTFDNWDYTPRQW